MAARVRARHTCACERRVSASSCAAAAARVTRGRGLQGCTLANFLEHVASLFKSPCLLAHLEPSSIMQCVAYSFTDVWWTTLEDVDYTVLEDGWEAVTNRNIVAKVEEGLNVSMALPGACPGVRRVLLTYQERVDQHVLYVSNRHGVGVIFQMEEGQLPPDMVVNVHCDDDGGDHYVISGCSMAGRELVNHRHSKTMELTVQNISDIFRRKLSVARNTRMVLVASRTGKVINSIHGRVYFPRYTRHSLKAERRLRAKTFFGDKVLWQFFVPK